MYLQTFQKHIIPDPDINFVEWANANFYLSREAASEYGRYRTARTPFVEEPLLDLSPQSDAETVVVIKPAQCAGTTVGLIFLCAIADISPGPTLFMQPTDSMAKSFSKKKLSTCLKHIKCLKGKVRDPKSRDSGNTILQKDFEGGSWMMTGANAGASYRQESIKYLILDDFDGFEIDIEGEGDPKELADRRTGTFSGRKVYINSTTTIKDTSNILRAYLESSQGEYHVPCPHCGEFQYLTWGGEDADYGVKFSRDADGQVVDAWYICKSCHGRIEETQKALMMEAGRYVHKYPNRRKVRGYRWNALYTPVGWVNTWAYIAQKFLEATKELKQGNPAKYITWLNSFMSEAYDTPGEKIEWEGLAARAEPYATMTIPMGGLLLVAGVDTQDDRLAVVIKAYGRGQESWLIYYTELIGDPEYQDVWDQLDILLGRTYRHECGIELNIVCMAIDTGGHRAQAVYNYCRTRSGRGVVAIRGASQPGKPVLNKPTLQDVTWRGVKINKGVQLWNVGTEVIKGTLDARLKMQIPGPGYLHFPMGLDDEYYKMLTGEALKTVFKNGIAIQEWKQTRARIEAKDCEVYAYFAACKYGIDRWQDHQWDRLEAAILGEAAKARGNVQKQVVPKPRLSIKSTFMRR